MTRAAKIDGDDQAEIKRRDLVVYCMALGTEITPFADHAPPIYAVMPLGI